MPDYLEPELRGVFLESIGHALPDGGRARLRLGAIFVRLLRAEWYRGRNRDDGLTGDARIRGLNPFIPDPRTRCPWRSSAKRRMEKGG